MKKTVSVFLVCAILFGTCLFSVAATSFENDTVNTDGWENLIDNFDPLVEYQFEDVAVHSEIPSKQRVSTELDVAIKEADPLSAVL